MIDNNSLLSAIEAKDTSRINEVNPLTSSRLQNDISIDVVNMSKLIHQMNNNNNNNDDIGYRTTRKKEDFTDRTTHSQKPSIDERTFTRRFHLETPKSPSKTKNPHHPSHSRTSNTFDSFRNTKETVISPQIIFYSKEQNEIVPLDQPQTKINFNIKTMRNINLLKYTINQVSLDSNLYYFGIYGDITYHRTMTENTTGDKAKVRQGYRIDICFDSLNQHNNKNILQYLTSKNNDIVVILKHLLYLNNYLSTFSGISKKILIQFSSFIKTISLKSFFGYYLLTTKMQTANNTVTIKNTPVSYEELEECAKNYIQFILEEFLKPFELGKNTGRESIDGKSNSKNYSRDEVYQMFIEIVNYLACDDTKMTQIIKDFNKVGSFFITNDLIDLNSSIIAHFFVTLNNPFDLLTKTWLNYKDDGGDYTNLNTNTNMNTNANTNTNSNSNTNTFINSIFNQRKRVGLTQTNGMGTKSSHYFIHNELYSSIEIIESYFYLLLVKMNSYYINSFMYCCGMANSDNINYSKGPYAFCFECEILFCIKCFIYHSKHHYFDFSCTIKRKIGNIQSSPKCFLNWNKNGKSNEFQNYKVTALSGNYVEDFILKNILKNYSGSADGYFDDIINNNTFNGNNTLINKTVKKITFSVFTFLDVFLIEYVYKLIYPFKNSTEYLEYYFNKIISQDVEFIELLRKISEKNTCDAYWDLIEHLTVLEEIEKDNEMMAIMNMAIDSYSPTIEDFYELHLKKEEEEENKKQRMNKVAVFKGDIGVEIQNQNLKGDLSQPIEYYSKYIQSRKMNFLKKNSMGENEEKMPLEHIFLILDSKLEVNCNNESKWYKAFNDKNTINNTLQKGTQVQYIDGFGTLFEYMIYYMDNIISSMAEFGNPYSINLLIS